MVLAFDYGRTYLVMGERIDKAMQIAQDFVFSGSNVMCISRMHPDLIGERWAGKKVDTIWLSERPGERNVPPDQLQSLVHRVLTFANGNKRAIIIIDGIEYLALFNDFHRLQMFFEQLNDIAMESGSILLVALDPRLFDLRSMARLRRFAEVVN